MANVISGTVWYVDTPSASPVKSGEGPVFVSSIQFSGYAQSTDQVVITDKAGTVVCSFVGQADLSTMSTNFGTGVWIRGLTVSTLSSGYVNVFLV